MGFHGGNVESAFCGFFSGGHTPAPEDRKQKVYGYIKIGQVPLKYISQVHAVTTSPENELRCAELGLDEIDSYRLAFHSGDFYHHYRFLLCYLVCER